MDLLLLFVLSGVALAWGKRFFSKRDSSAPHDQTCAGRPHCAFGPVVRIPGAPDHESTTCALSGGGGFLTGSLGGWMAAHMSTFVLINLESVAWWFYSSCLGVFFVALPFSRYMHIFTEIPLIFLRHYKLRSTEKEGSFDNFQVEACSRCGICIDPCQLQSVLGIDNVQSVYFLRDRRYKMLRLQVADTA